MQKRLTFTNGKFVLTDDGRESIVPLKAAAQLKQVADERALKVLDRAFVKRFPLPLPPLPPFLDPHQKEGVAWILTRGRSYLAHPPGAGKTCQAVVASLLLKEPGQTVFIVPPQLTLNWAAEVLQWAIKLTYAGLWPTISVVPESQRQEQVDWAAHYIIVPDSMLCKDWVLTNLVKLKKKFVGVDEASRFKDPTAERTNALFGGPLRDGVTSSPGLVYDCARSVLLDGSPMPNRPMELWAPTYAMFPEAIDFMSQSEFGFRYCGPTINDYGRYEFKHSSNEEELKARLQKEFMHVVPESTLHHPERRRSILTMTGDPRSPQHREWEKSNRTLIEVTALMDEDANQGDLAKFRRELGERKAPWIARYVAERLENKNESILLFVWHRSVAFELERLLAKHKPGLVIGGTKDLEREKIFREFQEGSRKLIIMNIMAGGRGHNLQNADRVIFGEFSWCGETNIQCEKRASRKGSTKEFVRCEYIVAPGSMDEIVLNAVFRKDKTVKRVIG